MRLRDFAGSLRKNHRQRIVMAGQSAGAIVGITLAFSIGPALFALLKAVALFIYPLDQKRVDEIERELAARRAAHPEVKPA